MDTTNDIADKEKVMITTVTMNAALDKAYFMNHVIENGTHKELYEMQGVYRDMYDKQSEFYRRENIDHEE